MLRSKVYLAGLLVLLTAATPASPQAGSAGPGVIRSANYVDTPITTIFTMISDMTNWSIVMSPMVTQSPPRVNLWIRNMSPDEVLRELALVAGLSIEREGRTVKVMTYDEYTQAYGVEKRVIQLAHAEARSIAEILRPFVTQADRARIVPDPKTNQIVLLVDSPLGDSLLNLVRELDVPLAGDSLKMVRLEHIEPGEVVTALETFLAQSAEAGAAGETKLRPVTGEQLTTVSIQAGGQYLVRFLPLPRLNAILLRGKASDVSNVAKLIKELDVEADLTVVSYELQHAQVDEAITVLEEFIDKRSKAGPPQNTLGGARLIVAMSKQNNRIVVQGSPADHEYVRSILDMTDQPLSPGSGAIRVYRLENTSAEEVAAVIESLVDSETATSGTLSTKPAVADSTRPKAATGPEYAVPPRKTHRPDGEAEAFLTSADLAGIQVATATQLNAVVIRGASRQHDELGVLIKELDRPRDQVLLEVSIVTVRADDLFKLGLEIGGQINVDTVSSIGFTSFGIGTVDVNTGQIQIDSPSPTGLNVALINNNDFSLVLNALQTVAHVRIVSQPRILVQDNEPAIISRLTQEPYETTSQVESSTITSFGGFVEAGTVLTAIPHISRMNWIRLDYEISLSSFGVRTAEQRSANLPPPRSETMSAGVVRIPSDHMVVLGGLTGERDDDTLSRMPLLSDLPLLGQLFQSETKTAVRETTFIFVRPVLLHDPTLRDLMLLSESYYNQAMPDQELYPANELKDFPEDQRNNAEEEDSDA